MRLKHVNFKGQGSPCPFHVTLTFRADTLEKITLDSGPSFQLIFSGTHPQQAEVTEWFESYLNGHPHSFPLPLFSESSRFSDKVLSELQNIPFGQTRSYLDVAISVGNTKAARAVGNACRVNPFPFVIPCHRVIQQSGALGGFAYGPAMKQQLLTFEKQFITAN